MNIHKHPHNPSPFNSNPPHTSPPVPFLFLHFPLVLLLCSQQIRPLFCSPFSSCTLNIIHCLPWTFVPTNLSKQKDGKGIKVSKAVHPPTTHTPTKEGLTLYASYHYHLVVRRRCCGYCYKKGGPSVCLLFVLHGEKTYCTICSTVWSRHHQCKATTFQKAKFVFFVEMLFVTVSRLE